MCRWSLSAAKTLKIKSSRYRVLVKRGMSQTAENWPLSQDPRSYKTYTEEKDQSSFFLRKYI